VTKARQQQQQQRQLQQQHSHDTCAVAAPACSPQQDKPARGSLLSPHCTAGAELLQHKLPSAASEAVDLTGDNGSPAAIKAEPGALGDSNGSGTPVMPPPPLSATPAAAAAAVPIFTLAAYDGSVPRALAQLMQLLQHMSAPDQLAERLDAGMQVLLTLPAGHMQLANFEACYASVQLWTGRGRFEKAAAAVDTMLTGLGV
jgi:hypothetical protein